MSRLLASAACVAAFATTSSVAFGAAVLPAGQYATVTEITAIVADPQSICAAAGLTAGTLLTGTGTVKGLGVAWAGNVFNINSPGTGDPTYGAADSIGLGGSCAYSALPAAAAFTATTAGSPAINTGFSAPTGGTTTCNSYGKGLTYTLVSGNGTIMIGPNTVPQSATIQILPPVGAGGLTTGFIIRATNVGLQFGGQTACLFNTVIAGSSSQK